MCVCGHLFVCVYMSVSAYVYVCVCVSWCCVCVCCAVYGLCGIPRYRAKQNQQYFFQLLCNSDNVDKMYNICLDKWINR